MSSIQTFANGSFYDPQLKIWSGEKDEFPYANDISLGSILLKALLDEPDHIAQICSDNGKQYTNREIAEKTISVSIHFDKLGFQQGDVVGFCGTNTDFVAPLFIAALLNGLIMCPLNMNNEKSIIKHVYGIAKPKIMFCDKSVYERIAESLTDLGLNSTIYIMDEQVENIPHISEFLEESLNVNLTEFRPAPLQVSNEKHPAFILCSSGTTGLLKGVSVAHAGLMFTNKQLVKTIPSVLVTSTMSWASGVITLVASTLASMTRILTRQNFSADHYLDLLEKYKVNFIQTAAPHMSEMLTSLTKNKRNLDSLKWYSCTGCYLPLSLLNKIKPFIPNAIITSGYALTELPGFGVCTSIAKASGINGMLRANVQLRIINDEGVNLEPNQQGEILVRSNFPFLGYYKDPEATAQNSDADGWIFTGDIGYMNENGELFVIDRKKEIYECDGFKWSPNEIENVILEVPQVAECCVCAIPHEERKDIAAALIVPKPGTSLSEADIYQYVAERLESYKHLHGGVYYVDSVPKTYSGKNLRREAVKICQSLQEK